MPMILVVQLVLLGLAPKIVAAQPWQICGTCNYTANSTYQWNLDVLSSSLFTKTPDSSNGLFSKTFSGVVPNTVYAVALCRGDMNCSACVDAAFHGARQLCALSMDATIFYDKCLLRYSDKDILNMDSISRVNTSAVVDGALTPMNIRSESMLPGWDSKDSKARNNSTQFFKTMLADAVLQVLSTTTKSYAAIRIDSTVPPLYCWAQSAPDMIEDICYNCLTNFSYVATANFAGRQGGRVLGLRCSLRYETNKFFDGEPCTSGSGSSNAAVQVQHPCPSFQYCC